MLKPFLLRLLPFKKKKILQVCCGYYHTLFVTEDNQVYATGRNFNGELGIGNTKDQKTPCLVTSLKGDKVIYVKCGGRHSFFKCFRNKEKIMMCGDNSHGQIGNGNLKNVLSPKLFKGIETSEIVQSLMLCFSSLFFTKGSPKHPKYPPSAPGRPLGAQNSGTCATGVPQRPTVAACFAM